MVWGMRNLEMNCAERQFVHFWWYWDLPINPSRRPSCSGKQDHDVRWRYPTAISRFRIHISISYRHFQVQVLMLLSLLLSLLVLPWTPTTPHTYLILRSFRSARSWRTCPRSSPTKLHVSVLPFCFLHFSSGDVTVLSTLGMSILRIT